MEQQICSFLEFTEKIPSRSENVVFVVVGFSLLYGPFNAFSLPPTAECAT
jgi:hypothetical protein